MTIEKNFLNKKVLYLSRNPPPEVDVTISLKIKKMPFNAPPYPETP